MSNYIGLNNRFGNLGLSSSPRGNFDGQSTLSGDNTAHLKGKLNNLNDTIITLTEALNTHKKEV